MQAFAPQKVIQADLNQGELLIGDGVNPTFDVLPLANRAQKRTLKVSLLRREVTRADREEMEQRFANRGRRNSRWTIEYPEKMPYYSNVLSAGEHGWLVYEESPHYHKISGVLVSRDGKTQQRFQFDCGENGTLLGTNGRLVIIRLDDQDEFQISEIKPRI